MNFYNFVRNNKSIHLPKMGKIREFDGYFVLPMEKLSESNGEDFDDLTIWMNDILSSKPEQKQTNYKDFDDRLPSKFKSQKDGLIEILEKLKSYISDDHHFDVHPGNIMMRGNTVVITDPYAMD